MKLNEKVFDILCFQIMVPVISVVTIFLPRSKYSTIHHHNSKWLFSVSYYQMDFPGGSVVKNPPTVQEMRVRSLGWEDPLEKEMGTCSSILAWKNPMAREALWAIVHEVAEVRHNWAPNHARTAYNWKDGRRKLLPGLPSAVPQRLFHTLTSLSSFNLSSWEKNSHTRSWVPGESSRTFYHFSCKGPDALIPKESLPLFVDSF